MRKGRPPSSTPDTPSTVPHARGPRGGAGTPPTVLRARGPQGGAGTPPHCAQCPGPRGGLAPEQQDSVGSPLQRGSALSLLSTSWPSPLTLALKFFPSSRCLDKWLVSQDALGPDCLPERPWGEASQCLRRTGQASHSFFPFAVVSRVCPGLDDGQFRASLAVTLPAS